MNRCLSGRTLLLLILFLSSCNKPSTLFTSLSASDTNINFTNQLPEREDLNILYYIYFYNGGGVSTGDINNDGLADIYFTANTPGNNKLYLNKGNFKFEDITSTAQVAGIADWCSGVTMADVNGDGWLDIYVSAIAGKFGLKGKNQLFINNKNATFTESGAAYGLDISSYAGQAAFFDYDHDGDLDCYVLNQSDRPYQNIVDTSNRRKYDAHAGDKLLRNDVNSDSKKFTDVSAQAGIYQSSLGYGLGLAVADINNDGWDDIYVGNDFHENDYYYVNNGNGTFTESGSQHFNHYSRFSMGNDIADYNNDGQPDIITADMLPNEERYLKTYGSDENADIYKLKLENNGYQQQSSRNCLQRNNGSGTSFSETGLISGVSATDWSWSPLFADFDNDGNKDLFISSGIVKRPVDMDFILYVSNLKFQGADQTTDKNKQAIDAMPDGSSHPFFFKGDGKTSFSDVSDNWGTGKMKGYFNGAAYADLDNDGNVDVVINSINAPATILKNNAPKKNSISISLTGNGANTKGIGSKVYLFDGKRVQYQQLMTTRGFQSSSEPKLHFGLDSMKADSLLIVWPDQTYQIVTQLPASGSLALKQTDANGQSFVYTNFFRSTEEEFVQQQELAWKHRENNFIDFNQQFLIPHALSARGPKVAVADINSDGLDDMYVTGAKGQGGSLLVQQKDGRFIARDSALFNKYNANDQVDVLFFDGNNDGAQDLYVVIGGNEDQTATSALADLFFMNDGKGNFSLQPSAIPTILTNKTCVAAADLDKDGDLDLFVGGGPNANQYGLPQSSYLLLNDGQGKFAAAPAGIADLNAIGMVTAASFADIDKDSWPDLVVTGEWMPLKIFKNFKGKFTASDINQSTGLWQSLLATDINGDGYVDMLAGNWGHNSKLYAGKNGPLKLYVKDFDNNGSIEQIMAYNIKGEEYPFLAKDELEKSLPLLKKAYLKYSEVAGKTVQYVFYDLFKDYKELKAEVLSSSVFMNDGKGNFMRYDLPADLQLAPVSTFVQLNQTEKGTEYLAGGNFFNVIPYEGRYDAQPLQLFTVSKGSSVQTNDIECSSSKLLSTLKGQVRDLKQIQMANGKGLLVARNNESLLIYRRDAIK